MYLADEAVNMVCAGQTLVCWSGARITVGPAADGGYAVTGYDNGQVFQRKMFDNPKYAVRFFRAVVKREGLVQAISAQRYQFLFPNGSSLEWVRPTSSSPKLLTPELPTTLRGPLPSMLDSAREPVTRMVEAS